MLFGLLSGLGFFAYVVMVYYNKTMNEVLDEVDKTIYQDKANTTTMTDPEGTQIIIKRPTRRRIRTK